MMNISAFLAEIADHRRRLELLERIEPVPVIARYKTAAGMTINNTTVTIVNFVTMDYDTRSLVTTGVNWLFRAVVGGYYAVSAAILFAGTNTWAEAEYGELSLYRDGVAFSVLDRLDNYASTGNVDLRLAGTDLIYIAAGSYIDIRAYQNSGGNLTLLNNAAYNYVSIWKV